MPAADRWADVTTARIPTKGLAALVSVRGREGVRVTVLGESAWVTWSSGAEAVAACLRPVRGVEFFSQRGGVWFRFGAKVPTSDGPPSETGRPLEAVLVPAKFTPIPPSPTIASRLPVTLVRGGLPQPVTALACRVAELEAWADTATTRELAAVTAARCGDRAILRGKTLPTIPSTARFWGEAVLIPLGFRCEPDVSAATLRAAVGAVDEELLVLTESATEILPLMAFAPLTRAGVRLAIRGVHA